MVAGIMAADNTAIIDGMGSDGTDGSAARKTGIDRPANETETGRVH
jgi:hypothetical protein